MTSTLFGNYLPCSPGCSKCSCAPLAKPKKTFSPFLLVISLLAPVQLYAYGSDSPRDKPSIPPRDKYYVEERLLKMPEQLEEPVQVEELSPVDVKFSGFIKCLFYGDTRQTVNFSDGYYLLSPAKKNLDACKKDINAQPSLGGSTIETNFHVDVNGPEIFGAKSYGCMEGNLMAIPASFINRMRLRFSYIELTWETVKVLFGQFWHPLFMPTYGGCFANTVAWDFGAAIDTVGNEPQLRVTKEWEHVRLMGTIATQMEYQSRGPGPVGANPGITTKYHRDAVVPNFDGQIHFFKDANNLIGIAADYKRLRPRLSSTVTTNNVPVTYKVDETISSVAASLFGAGLFGDFHIAAKVSYLENMNFLFTLSGFSVTCQNTVTGERKYANTRDVTAWTDMEVRGKYSPGIFIGLAKNIGAKKQIFPKIGDEVTIYPLIGFEGADFDYLFRVAPRFRASFESLTLLAEVNITRTAFGTLDCKGKVKNTCPVTNARFILGTQFTY